MMLLQGAHRQSKAATFLLFSSCARHEAGFLSFDINHATTDG